MSYKYDFTVAKNLDEDLNKAWIKDVMRDLARDNFTTVGTDNEMYEFVRYIKDPKAIHNQMSIVIQDLGNAFNIGIESDTKDPANDIPLLMTGMYLEDKALMLCTIINATLVEKQFKAARRGFIIGVAVTAAIVAAVVIAKNKDAIQAAIKGGVENLDAASATLKEASVASVLAEGAKSEAHEVVAAAKSSMLAGEISKATLDTTRQNMSNVVKEAVTQASTANAAAAEIGTMTKVGVKGLEGARTVGEQASKVGAAALGTQAGQVVAQAGATAGSAIAGFANPIVTSAGKVIAAEPASAAFLLGVIAFDASFLIGSWRITMPTIASAKGERNVFQVKLNRDSKATYMNLPSSAVVGPTKYQRVVAVKNAMTHDGALLLMFSCEENGKTVGLKVHPAGANGISLLEIWYIVGDKEKSVKLNGSKTGYEELLVLAYDWFVENHCAATNYSNAYIATVAKNPKLLEKLSESDKDTVDSDPYASDKEPSLEDFASLMTA